MIQKISLGVLVFLVLSGCQKLETPVIEPIIVSTTNKPFEGAYWVNTDDYYGEGYSFDLMDDSRLENRDVFIVNNEYELALLITIFYEQGMYELYYVESVPLDITRVYLYALALSPYEIWWEDYTLDVADDLEIYSAEFSYDFEEMHAINQHIDEWNKENNSSYYTQDEQAEFIFNDLVNRVSYDDEAALEVQRSSNAYKALGALQDESAVCNGYALAFLGLLKDVDIPALVIASDVDDHAWNLVYYEGEWVYFDVTFEDTDGIEDEYYYYFALTSDDLKYDHIFDESGPDTLSEEDYLALANYVFPK